MTSAHEGDAPARPSPDDASINTTRGYVRLTQRANDAVEAISHLVA